MAEYFTESREYLEAENMKKEAERVIFSSEFRPCTSFLSDVTNFLKTRGDIEQKTTNALSVCPPQKDR